MRLPPIAGYLLAGIVIGPFTPGYVADLKLATELAEIGIILLMFGVGLHFSLKDLLSVRSIAIPGAIGQITVATLLGLGLAWVLGWSLGAGVVFGLALSVASTVVLLRALQERGWVETERGRIAVGWLIVEDLVMVLTLVLVPALSGFLGGVQPAAQANPGLAAWLGGETVWMTLAITAVKVAAFVVVMLLAGRKLIPWALHFVAHTGSRELFRLSVLAIALGVAFFAAQLFGVSFALGAFFAGMVLAESQLSTQAARETLPLRDAFAVIFFVSVGMLFDPGVVLKHPLAVVATFLIIVVGKSVAAYFIVIAFGHTRRVALTISASLAQIGEFSFILVVLGTDLQILPALSRDLVVAGALLSILINPLLFIALDRREARIEQAEGPPEPVASAPVAATEHERTTLSGHAVLVGYGRVGSRVEPALHAAGIPLLVIDEEAATLEGPKARGVETFLGPVGEKALLDRLNLGEAKWLISAIPDAFEAGHLIEAARAANPNIRILARAHSTEATDYLRSLGADVIFMAEEQVARSMIEEVLTPGAAAAAPPAPAQEPASTDDPPRVGQPL